MVQHIRQSQFVITYGPGAIIEGRKGPRMILDPNIGLFKRLGKDPQRFEISDQKMSQGLLGGARIFELPSNAKLDKPERFYVYATKPFPEWSLCTSHWKLHKSRKACPQCGNLKSGNEEAIRFVMACPGGHLDDVDWHYLVHRGSTCDAESYDWNGRGRSLRDVDIACTKCDKHVNLADAFSRDWHCSGRRPEREELGSGPDRPGCELKSKIILRQATNLRIPEIISVFTVPPRCTVLHNLLSRSSIYHGLKWNPPQSKDQLLAGLQNLRNEIGDSTIEEISRYPWEEILRVIQDIMQPVPSDFAGVLREEFSSLIDASIHGYPPLRGPKPSSPVRFHVDSSAIKKVAGPKGNIFRIVPVSPLHTLLVQKGYRRLDPDPRKSDFVDVSFKDHESTHWYPGVEHFGEGIFVMLDANEGYHFALKGEYSKSWLEAFRSHDQEIYPEYLFRNKPAAIELHPLFVWWHSLSHLLMRVLALDSGYSSASIRERIYLSVEEKGVRGGIILYTVQPGADGTLGGLVSLVPSFATILERASQLMQTCSNDPLCSEQKFKHGSYFGASCYACLLVSETSCENRNMWLDRHVLLEGQP